MKWRTSALDKITVYYDLTILSSKWGLRFIIVPQYDKDKGEMISMGQKPAIVQDDIRKECVVSMDNKSLMVTGNVTWESTNCSAESRNFDVQIQHRWTNCSPQEGTNSQNESIIFSLLARKQRTTHERQHQQKYTLSQVDESIHNKLLADCKQWSNENPSLECDSGIITNQGNNGWWRLERVKVGTPRASAANYFALGGSLFGLRPQSKDRAIYRLKVCSQRMIIGQNDGMQCRNCLVFSQSLLSSL